MKEIYFWGTGKRAVDFVPFYKRFLSDKYRILAFIDNKTMDVFFEWNVISPSSIRENTEIEAIVILNDFYEDIICQVKKEWPYLVEKVIDYRRFLQEIIDEDIIKIKNKSVTFYGDEEMFKLAKLRSKYAFNRIRYISKREKLLEESDFVFLCTERLIKSHTRNKLEKDLLKRLSDEQNISQDKIIFYDEWKWIIFSDRIIREVKENGITFYIISVSDPIRGWGNLLTRVAGEITYAERNRWIPCVDFKNAENMYLDSKMIGRDNAWEYYFEPLNRYSLEEAYVGDCVILSGIDMHTNEVPNVSKIELNCFMKDFINKSYTRLWKDRKNVLGVIYRGTDYCRDITNHPIPMKIDEFAESVEIHLSKSECNYIFLATEISEVTDYFKDKYGDRCFYTNQIRVKEGERRFLSSIHFDRKNDAYLRGREYIEVLYLLSKCDALVGPRIGAFECAKMLNGNRYRYICEI